MNILQTEKLPPAREHLSLQVSFAGEKKKKKNHTQKAHYELDVPIKKSPPSVHVTTLTGSLEQNNTHHTAFTAELT